MTIRKVTDLAFACVFLGLGCGRSDKGVNLELMSSANTCLTPQNHKCDGFQKTQPLIKDPYRFGFLFTG